MSVNRGAKKATDLVCRSLVSKTMNPEIPNCLSPEIYFPDASNVIETAAVDAPALARDTPKGCRPSPASVASAARERLPA